MINTGTLYFFCGKMAAGKTTLAQSIAKQSGCLYLSEDQLLAGLYPDTVTDVKSYAECSGRIRATLQDHCSGILNQGISLVLDFPANTPKQRLWMQSILNLSGAPHELHYIDSSDARCIQQLLKRNADNPDANPTDTIAMFEAMVPYFDPPTESEGFNLVLHQND